MIKQIENVKTHNFNSLLPLNLDFYLNRRNVYKNINKKVTKKCCNILI